MVFHRFQQFLELVKRFTDEVFSETGPFMHLSNHVFLSQEFQKSSSYKGHFSLQMFKVYRKFRKCNKIPAKCFLFSDNGTRTGSGKFSLL